MSQPPDEPIEHQPEDVPSEDLPADEELAPTEKLPASEEGAPPGEVPPDEARTRIMEQRRVPPEPPEGPPGPPPPHWRPPGGYWPWLAGLLALVIAGLLLAYFLTRDDDDESTTVSVPAVVGFSQPEAERQTRVAGLTPAIRNVLSSSGAPGTVVAQSPAAGEEVDRGSTLTLSVSGGSPPVTVPDLIGLNEAQAGVRLTDAGFEYRINRETSDQPSGIVIAQEPAPGAKADEGSTVEVTVSRGGSTTTTTTTTTTVTTVTTVSVPDVVGMTQDEATQALTSAGLVPRIEIVESSQSPGSVISQTPDAGTQVGTGTPVTIGIASPVGPTG